MGDNEANYVSATAQKQVISIVSSRHGCTQSGVNNRNTLSHSSFSIQQGLYLHIF